MGVRLKRLVAFVIDWNITLFPVVFIYSFLISFLKQQSEIESLIISVAFLLVVFAFGAFILRDVIFKGRSLGKRIFGLYIYDRNSLEKASTKQCVLRNAFLFLYIIDGIILLVTGQTIGDRVAGTSVMTKRDFESGTKEI